MSIRDDPELENAFVFFGLTTGQLSDAFIEVVSYAVWSYGETRCFVCSEPMRAHVLAALRGYTLSHKFMQE
jgi:hypothetical protein